VPKSADISVFLILTILGRDIFGTETKNAPLWGGTFDPRLIAPMPVKVKKYAANAVF